MDMKRILQAMDGVATKPVAGVDSMARFLRVVKEASVEYLPPDPEVSAQLRAQATASMDADRPKHQANAFIRFSSGMYDQSTLPKTMVIKPGVTLPVKFNPIKNMDSDVLNNAIAANKLLPPDLQYSSSELSQVVGQNAIQETPEVLPAQQQALAPYLVKDPDGSQYYDYPSTDPKEKGAVMGTTIKGPEYLAHIKSPQGQAEVIKHLLTTTDPKNAVPQATVTNTSVDDKNVFPDGLEENTLRKFLSIVKKNDVSILNEGSPHKVSLPVQMAMQHYQQEKSTHKPVGRETTIGKYFHKVEEEIAEEKANRRQLMNQYASVIAERVMIKESNNPGFKPGPGSPGIMPNEGMSAQVKLSRAWDREKAKSTASIDRARQAKAEFEKEWKEKQEKQSQEKNPIKEANKLARKMKENTVAPVKPPKSKAVKPKAKTSVCRAGQVQTGVQSKNGMTVPKCSVKKVL